MEEIPAVTDTLKASTLNYNFAPDLSAKDIVKIEKAVLRHLHFNIHHITIIDYIDYFMYRCFFDGGKCLLDDCNYKFKLNMIYYICELASIQPQYHQYYNFCIAANAFFVVMAITDVDLNGLHCSEITKCKDRICRHFLMDCIFDPIRFTHSKYGNDAYFAVSEFLSLWTKQ